MPIYNAEHDLHAAIDNIIKQTFQDWELIVVDDGSTDGSISIVKSFSDSRIRLIELGQNGGIVRALNVGWELSRGEWIARMDGDDLCVNDRLEKQLALAQSQNLDICGSHWLQIDDDGKFLQYHFAPTSSDELVATLASTVPYAHGSVLLKKSFFDGNGLRYTPGSAEDYRLWIESFEKGAKFGLVTEHLYHHRVHANSITKTQFTNQSRASKILRRNFVNSNQTACLNALVGLQDKFLYLQNMMKVHALYLAFMCGKKHGSYSVILNMLKKASWQIKIHALVRILKS